MTTELFGSTSRNWLNGKERQRGISNQKKQKVQCHRVRNRTISGSNGHRVNCTCRVMVVGEAGEVWQEADSEHLCTLERDSTNFRSTVDSSYLQ